MGPKKLSQSQIQSGMDKYVEVSENVDSQEPPAWAKTLIAEFREMRSEIANLNTHVAEKIEKAEKKIDATKKELEDKIEDLEFNSRKYNLLLWGLGKTTSENCQEKVNSFLRSELGFTTDIEMAACHPVRGETVIMRFVRMSDRDAVLKCGNKLKGKQYSLKTDLPPRLRKLRADLRADAKQMRGDGRVVRVVERGKGVYLQERHGGNVWKTV